MLLPYSVAGLHKNIVDVENVVVGATHAYVFFSPNYGDLHAYLRSKIKLTEREACRLFHQLVMGVKHCHERGIVLHDIKLRKCVFADKQK
jgi:serine/threonine protein kinase